VRRNLDLGTLDHDPARSISVEQHSGDVLAKLREVLLELDLIEEIEKMQLAVNASERTDTPRRDHQLLGCFRAFPLATLQRQEADDQLQAVDEPVLEILGQHDLPRVLLAQQRGLACERLFQLGGDRRDLA